MLILDYAHANLDFLIIFNIITICLENSIIFIIVRVVCVACFPLLLEFFLV